MCIIADILPRLAGDLSSLSSKYYPFGVHLNVPIHQVECFETSFQKDCYTILLKIIDYWLCNTQESNRLESLLVALDKVERPDLKKDIKSNYKEEDFRGKFLLFL